MKQLRFKFLAFAVLLSLAVQAQTTFDSEEGCLNVANVFPAPTHAANQN